MLGTMARRGITSGAAAFVAAVALASAACEPAGQEVTVIQPAAPGAVPTEVVLTEANMAAVLIAANNATIQRAQVARTRAANPQVRAFAEQILVEHQAAGQVIQQQAQRFGITPQPETIAAQLDANAAQTVAMMQTATGTEVDRIFLESEIANRRWLIQTLDAAVLPMVPNGGVEREVRDLRQVLSTRLLQAEQLLAATPRTLTGQQQMQQQQMQQQQMQQQQMQQQQPMHRNHRMNNNNNNNR